jgi:hypothetical protein
MVAASTGLVSQALIARGQKIAPVLHQAHHGRSLDLGRSGINGCSRTATAAQFRYGVHVSDRAMAGSQHAW